MSTATNSIEAIAAQTQLRQTRNEFRSLVVELQSNPFPRSKTMKVLLSAGGQKSIAYALGGTGLGTLLGLKGSSSLVGRVVRSVVVGTLMKKLWTGMRR